MPALGSSRTAYLVCMVQRCGSNVLCEALSRTGVAGHPTEYFTPAFPGSATLGHAMAGFEQSPWARERGVASLSEFFAVVVREGSTPNGVFGAKLPWNALDALLARLGELPQGEALPPLERLRAGLGPVRFVRVQRRDRLRQAVSWAIAAQTGLYSSHEAERRAPLREPSFDFGLVDRLLREIEKAEQGWDAFFESIGSQPLRLAYEELDRDLAGAVGRVLDWLGVSAAPKAAAAPGDVVAPRLDPASLRHQRQSSALNDEWVDAYRARRHDPLA